MAPKPSEPSRCWIIQAAHFLVAYCRMKRGPRRSQILRNRSSFKKKLRQLKVSSERSGRVGAPEGNSSARLKPAGTGRFGLAACTMESEMTMARVQDDIW